MLISVLGLQWGDEGKGKIIDYLSKEMDWIIRFSGGANAGHTIIVNKKKYVFHLLPSGILHPNVHVLLGPGMVIDPEELVKELDMLTACGVEWRKRVFISDRAHIVLPSYKEMDKKIEKTRKRKIGTTMRGIGVSYSQKALRLSVRVGDIEHKKEWGIKKKKDIVFLKEHASLFSTLKVNHYGILENIEEQERVLYEGAQGVLLDPDIGTYPYVTSGSTSLNGVYSCGTPQGRGIEEVLGVAKIYNTRVGEGYFPTEYRPHEEELLTQVREKGHEVGSTTGRIRRCGHLDLLALKYACRMSSTTSLALTHFDVFDTFSEIHVCIAYEIDNAVVNYFPSVFTREQKIEPVLKKMRGWNSSTKQMQHWNELPEQALEFIQFIEDFIGVEVKLLSTGENRNQTILKYGRKDGFL